ncbi:hypothetical protein [Microvirga pudoricolor]|uniref:hypothetical protein n=1 Tax=Microvirga pudoricolor TaxID=2778729 RepID=UPI00195186C4|nr:hypothetical protein [Microvirga pudoricolor]MBM6594424.1 hypothetical protein [Microvirga pudoricolor]
MAPPLSEQAIRFTLSTGATDAPSQLRRLLRVAAPPQVLVIDGDFSGSFADPSEANDLISVLTDANLPVIAAPSGSIGPQGAAILLLCDQVVLEAGAALSGHWRDGPCLAALAHRRLGPLLARAIFFDDRTDLLDILADAGIAKKADDPGGSLDSILSRLGGRSASMAKRALKAAAELPFREALNYDRWLHGRSGDETR